MGQLNECQISEEDIEEFLENKNNSSCLADLRDMPSSAVSAIEKDKNKRETLKELLKKYFAEATQIKIAPKKVTQHLSSLFQKRTGLNKRDNEEDIYQLYKVVVSYSEGRKDRVLFSIKRTE